jgi:predicted ATPase
MKLKRACIKGLNDKVDCNIEFHDDINIVTGINGSGKTTLLKMLWYAISGNIEHLISEINFESFELETSHFSLSLIYKDSIIQWKYIENEIEKSGRSDDANISFNPTEKLEKLKSLIITSKTSSLFFPTFRRIEGGYSMLFPRNKGLQEKSIKTYSDLLQLQRERDNIDLQDNLDKLSNRLTASEHKFICSMSTYDLVSLLTTHYARASEKTNEYYLEFSTLISNQVEAIKSDIESNKQEALTILSKIQQENTTVNNRRNQLLKPFEVLSELVVKVLLYKGIELGAVTLGESHDAIDSKFLSAGEQQMLSFLCYNAFYENSVIFIDEPELSLHPDWQRRLFPNLMKQQSSNQFIVATHSPFIYSKYADKEIVLSQEKGE